VLLDCYIGPFETLLDQSDSRSGTNYCIKFYNYSFLDVQLFLCVLRDVIIELDSGDYSEHENETYRQQIYHVSLFDFSICTASTEGSYLNHQTSQKNHRTNIYIHTKSLTC